MNSNYIILIILLMLIGINVYILMYEKKELNSIKYNISKLQQNNKDLNNLKEIKDQIKNLNNKLNNISSKMEKIEKSNDLFNSRLNYIESSINKKISTLNDKINTINENLSIVRKYSYAILRTTYDIIHDISLIKSELNNLNESIICINNSEVLEKINELLNELEELSSKISTMNDWLKKSEVNDTILKKYLPGTYYNLSKCIDNKVADLSCISFLLYNKDFLNYSTDNETYNKEDVLVSPIEFIKNKKGDCEDFSWFYLQLLNYLKKKYQIKYLILLDYSKNVNCNIYKENENFWYIENCTKKTIDLSKYKYFYVYCYAINETFGHCINIICSEPFSNSTKNLFTDNCIFFEPQNYGFIIKKEIINDKVYLYSDPTKKETITQSLDLINNTIYCEFWKNNKLLCVKFN